jgi:hypothetical protein
LRAYDISVLDRYNCSGYLGISDGRSQYMNGIMGSGVV